MSKPGPLLPSERVPQTNITNFPPWNRMDEFNAALEKAKKAQSGVVIDSVLPEFDPFVSRSRIFLVKTPECVKRILNEQK